MPALDELDLVRQLLDAPAPRGDVIAAGRVSLDADAAREAGRQLTRRRPPLARGARHSSRAWPVKPAVLISAVATAAIVVATAIVTGWPAGHTGTGRPASSSRAPGRTGAGSLSGPAVQRAMLAALTTNSGRILYVHRSSRGSTPAVAQQDWFWPSQPLPGQRVHMLIVQPPWEFEITFTAAAGDRYTAGTTGGPAISGTVLAIDNQARTWSIQRAVRIAPTLPDATSRTWLRTAIGEHAFSIAARTRLDGQSAIELQTTRSGPGGLVYHLWVSARTYLPLRQVKLNWNGPGTTLRFDFRYLPATRASLAKVAPAIPPGYKQVPAS